MRSIRRTVFSTALTVPIGILLAAAPASAANTGLVGGGAHGVSVNVGTPLGGLVTVAPTPSVTLPATGGGPFTNSLASANVPGVLSVGLMDVSTQGALGAAGFSRSSARVADVNAVNGALTADAVSSNCSIDSAGNMTGSSSLVNARVLGGQPLAANPAPNTVIPIPLVGSLTFNEQQTTIVPGGNRTITVNAVHLRLTGLLTGDVILAQSKCVSRI